MALARPVSWIQGKFGIPLDAAEVRNFDPSQFTRKVGKWWIGSTIKKKSNTR